MMETIMTPERSWFLTLTYDDENIPHTTGADGAPVQTLEKARFLKWVNNTMRDVGLYRYYAIGEYGDITKRPHYHMAVFPSDPAQADKICNLWKRKGFTQMGEMQDERARYLANYSTKKLTKPDDPRLDGNQEPEFRTSSRNPPLGAAFVEALIKHYQQPKWQKLIAERGDVERTFRLGGRIYPLGQWPLKKIREGLRIPVKHSDRIEANPNYLDFHEIQEAEINPLEADKLWKKFNAETKRKLYRSESQKL